MANTRMIAKRGRPTAIYSDNGTNFRGSDNEMKNALRDLDHTRIENGLSCKSIQWIFNPPASPHMRGSWERLIRSVKTALRCILKKRAPKDETSSTL